MKALTHNDFIVLLLAISTMLMLSRVVAELGKKMKLPMVMGELIVGIALGPTILGKLAPQVFNYLFPIYADPNIDPAFAHVNQNVSIALDGIFKLSVVMLLFVAGMEVQLPIVLRQGKVAI